MLSEGRKFFKWLGISVVVDWMKISSHKDPRKLPEDMLSEDEIEKMIWVGIGTVGRNIPMRYYAIRMHLKRIATRAGINFLFKYEDESIIP